jgi:HAD superfamily hydrolase (TIGR01509 family)
VCQNQSRSNASDSRKSMPDQVVIEGVTLVPARQVEEDARLCMEWRNDPATRTMSYHRELEEWPRFWLQYRDSYFLYLELPPMFALYRRERIGFLRFRPYVFALPQMVRSVDIGINIAPEWRSQGWGKRVIAAATFHLFCEGVDQVIAEIKPENTASRKAFANAGYALMDGLDRTIPDLTESVRILRYIATRSLALPRAVQWVFLDLDGTIADSMSVLYDVYVTFLSTHGRTGNEREFGELVGPRIMEAIALLKERHSLVGSIEALRDQYFSVLEVAYAGVLPMRGALDLVRALRAQGYRLALVTASMRAWVVPFLERQVWTDLFDVCVTGDDVLEAKPAPDIYIEALRRAGTSDAQAIAVEDSRNGVLSAVRAGIRAIAIGPQEREQALLKCGAHTVVRGLEQVMAVVEQFA